MKISSRSGVFRGIFERYRFHSSCFHAAKPLWFILAAWTGHVSARYCMLYCAWITERTEPEHSEWVLWSMRTSVFLLSSYSDKRVACRPLGASCVRNFPLVVYELCRLGIVRIWTLVFLYSYMYAAMTRHCLRLYSISISIAVFYCMQGIGNADWSI